MAKYWSTSASIIHLVGHEFSTSLQHSSSLKHDQHQEAYNCELSELINESRGRKLVVQVGDAQIIAAAKRFLHLSLRM